MTHPGPQISYPTPVSASPVVPRKPRRWLGVAVIAVLSVVALVGAYLGVRALDTPSAPDAPTGLELTKEPGRVKATWQSVDGASGYRIVRDDVVVYSGPHTTATDITVTKGEHSYRVFAIKDDRDSAASESESIAAGAGWGLYAPLVGQFPDLVPQAPDIASSFEGTRCVWMIVPSLDERGPAENGNGNQRTVARIRCATQGLERNFALTWYVNQDARNAAFSKEAETGHPVSWKHGTATIDPVKGRGMFKISDDPAQELSTVIIAGAIKLTEQQILDFANSLPI